MPTAVMNVLMNRRQRKRVKLSLAYAMIRFMLRKRQPLKLLSDAYIESHSVGCIFTVVKNKLLPLRKLTSH